MLLNIASKNSKSSLNIYTPDQVQPNAIDLRLDKVFAFSQGSYFRISDEEKIHCRKVEVPLESDGYWILERGSYEVQFEGIVSMGEGEAGWVITRSSFNRNAVFITSGLYDSGYVGAMAGMLHVNIDAAIIKKGTRVGQFVLTKAESLHLYDGSYGIKDGVIKAEEARYHE